MKILVVLLLAAALQAQTYLPQAFIATGASYTHYAAPPLVAGFVSVAVQVGTASRTYSITTVDITGRGSSVRTGVGFVALQAGNFNLLTHMDGGLTSTANTAVGSFSGGIMVLYDLSGLVKVFRHTYALGVVRVVNVAGTGVYPIYELGIGHAF